MYKIYKNIFCGGGRGRSEGSQYILKKRFIWLGLDFEPVQTSRKSVTTFALISFWNNTFFLNSSSFKTSVRYHFQSNDAVTFRHREIPNHHVAETLHFSSSQNPKLLISLASPIRRRRNPMRRPQSPRRHTIRYPLVPFPMHFLLNCIVCISVHFDLILLAAGSVKKRVEDVVPIATGHEREEIQAELEVLDRGYFIFIFSRLIIRSQNASNA